MNLEYKKNPKSRDTKGCWTVRRLKYDVIKERYSEALKQFGKEQIGNLDRDIHEQNKHVSEKMENAAGKALITAKAPLTSKRKAVFDRLNKALKLWKNYIQI